MDSLQLTPRLLPPCLLFSTAVLEEVLVAQKDRDRALMSRLLLANEERDEALRRARRLQEAAEYDRLNCSSSLTFTHQTINYKNSLECGQQPVRAV